MKRISNIFIIVFLAALVLASSCVRRDLDMEYLDSAEIAVVFDWSRAKINPDGATVTFFPIDGGEPIVKLTHSDTTIVSLKVGRYSIIGFNETTVDFDNIEFRGTDHFATYEAVVKKEDIKADPVIWKNPDILASASIGDFVVTTDMVQETRTRTRTKTRTKSRSLVLSPSLTITLQPRRVVYPAVVVAKIHGLNNIAASGAYVSGFTEAVNLSNYKTSSYSTRQKFPFSKITYTDGSTRNGTASGTLTSFGLRDHQGEAGLNGYDLDFRATLKDGSGFDRKFDISASITTVNIEIGIQINIDIGLGEGGPIIIPDIGGGGGGWNIKVGDWEEVIVPITL